MEPQRSGAERLGAPQEKALALSKQLNGWEQPSSDTGTIIPEREVGPEQQCDVVRQNGAGEKRARRRTVAWHPVNRQKRQIMLTLLYKSS